MNKTASSLNLGALTLCHRIALQTHEDMLRRDDLEGTLLDQLPPGTLLLSPDFDIEAPAAGQSTHQQLDDDAIAERWQNRLRRIHDRGAMMIAPLRHLGGYAQTAIGVDAPLGVTRSPLRTQIQDSFRRPVASEHLLPLSLAMIDDVLAAYGRSALLAQAIGFDGVELRADSPHLPSQFLHNRINTRMDAYGGSIGNRERFLMESVQQLVDVFGAPRVSVRLSPRLDAGASEDTNAERLYQHLLRELSGLELACIHLSLPDNQALEPTLQALRGCATEPLLMSAAGLGSHIEALLTRRLVDAVVVDHPSSLPPRPLAPGA